MFITLAAICTVRIIHTINGVGFYNLYSRQLTIVLSLVQTQLLVVCFTEIAIVWVTLCKVSEGFFSFNGRTVLLRKVGAYALAMTALAICVLLDDISRVSRYQFIANGFTLLYTGIVSFCVIVIMKFSEYSVVFHTFS